MDTNLYKKLDEKTLGSKNPASNSIKKMLKKYDNYVNEIRQEAQNVFDGQSEITQTQINTFYLKAEQHNKDIDNLMQQWSNVAVAGSFKTGQGMVDQLARQIDSEGGALLLPKNRPRVKKYIDDLSGRVYREVKMVNEDMRRRLDNIIIDGLKESKGIGVVKRPGIRGGKTTQDLIGTRLYQAINDDGLKLVDSAGRKWDPTAYTKMYARTRTREIQVEGIRTRMHENGLRLVQISEHIDVDGMDICNEYESNIYCTEGTHPKYPQIPEYPPYHPNCAHVITPYVEELRDFIKARKNGASIDEAGNMATGNMGDNVYDKKMLNKKPFSRTNKVDNVKANFNENKHNFGMYEREMMDKAEDAMGGSINANPKKYSQQRLAQRFDMIEGEDRENIRKAYNYYTGEYTDDVAEMTQDNFKDFVNRLQSQWNSTSADSNTNSIAFQKAVKSEFGLDDAGDYWDAKLASKVDSTFREAPEIKKGMQKVAREIYNDTQNVLDDVLDEGQDFIELYRGMNTESIPSYLNGVNVNGEVAQVANVNLNPISSYSWDAEVARNVFGSGPGNNIMMTTRVPRDKVFGVGFNGFGTSFEQEAVVFGGTDSHITYCINSKIKQLNKVGYGELKDKIKQATNAYQGG